MSKRNILTLQETCSGCFACANVCPKDAISLPENKEGFYFPQIDSSKCIDCGLCDKICPNLTRSGALTMQKAFYGWSNNDDVRKASSSGGIFYHLASTIIENTGIVYGASFNYKDMIRLECHSTDEVDLQELMRSKYVQSHVGYAYRKIKDDLNNGRKVLFCGTPCQVGGLKSYLRRDYDNLILVDFVCHGVPSMSMLRLHIKYLGLKNITEICFRPKNREWLDDFEIIYDSGKRKYSIPWQFDEYFKAFQYYKNIRRSCKHCIYSRGLRQSDITIADFSGYRKYAPSIYDPKGISLVLANSRRGMGLLNSFKLNTSVTLNEIPLKFAEYAYARDRESEDFYYKLDERNRFINSVYQHGYKNAIKQSGLKTRKIDLYVFKLKRIVKSFIGK